MSWRDRARELKDQITALYVAARHPRVPWYAKAVAALVVGYALSPIDLIPDFIPILGYLDDLLLLPLGISLVIALIPSAVWQECLEKAKTVARPGKRSWIAAAFIVSIWLVIGWLGLRYVRSR